jgi:thiol-disulfide isomerase/thioredoxin
MRKHYYSFFRIAGAALLFAAVFILPSCKAKAQGSASSASAQGASSEMEKLFASAGLRLLSQKVTPRDFSLSLVSQAETQDLSALKGRVVFLNFWATWCGPCRSEMPSMEALYNRYKDEGFEILAVNCMESKPEVLAFMKNNGLSFPAALDEDGKVSNSYGIQAIPTTFILDRDGQIIVRLVGSINWDTPAMHAALESLLNS